MRELLRKDALFFTRSKTSLLMIFLVPALTMLILGNMFGEQHATGIEVVLCDGDSSSLSSAYARLFNSSAFSTSFRQDVACAEEGIASVERGQIAAVVIIPSGFEASILSGHRSAVRLYLDNSAPESAQLIESSVTAVSRQLSSEVALGTLSVLQTSMNGLGESMYLAEINLQSTRDLLSGMEGNIGMMAQELDSLELNKFSASIGDMEAFVSNQSASLGGVNATVDSTLSQIASANSTLNKSRALLADADGLLESDVAQGEQALAAIKTIRAGVNTTYASLGCNATSCGPLGDALSNITLLEQSLAKRIDAEKKMRSDISQISASFGDMEVQLANATVQLSSAKESAADLKLQLDSIKLTLAELNSTLAKYSLSKDNSLAVLRQSNSSLYEIRKGLGDAIPKVQDIRTSLFSLANKNPEDVVRPVDVSSEKVFFSSRFSYVFPALVSIILMFSILLLAANSLFFEISEGTLLRSYLSETPLWKLILSKVLVLEAVAAVQTAVMYAVSAVFFGITLSNIPEFLGLALLLSLAFVLLGLLVGSLAGDQSTALLVIVAIVIPSIFLSGSLFPFEFMPQTLRTLSELLPLTIGAKVMKGITVYGVYALPIGLLAYSLAFAAALALALPKRIRS